MDIITYIINKLSNALPVFVGDSVPAVRPDEMVIITRIGGSSDNILERPAIDIDSYSTSNYLATQLALQVEQELFKLETGELITNVERSTMYDDPSTDEIPRVTGSYELVAHIK